MRELAEILTYNRSIHTKSFKRVTVRPLQLVSLSKFHFHIKRRRSAHSNVGQGGNPRWISEWDITCLLLLSDDDPTANTAVRVFRLAMMICYKRNNHKKSSRVIE